MKRPLAAALLVVALASCGDGGEDGDDARADCPGPGDTITASRPVVKVTSDEEGCSFTATERRAIATRSVVRIETGDQGAGRAALVFADVGVCALRQLDAEKPAIVVTRHPQGALFQQRRGISICTIQGTVRTICRNSTVEISGDADGVAQTRIGCDPDPVVAVTPYRGAITVTTPSGRQWDLAPGQELNVYPDPQSSVPAPAVESTEFATWQVETFQEQSEMLELEFVPLVPSPTPSPTITSSPGAPVNVVPPSVRWLTVGETVTSDVGTWNGEPSSFQITWEAGCSVDGSGCRATGVIGDVYSPSGEDCDYVRSIVTAINDSGASVPVPSAPFDIQCVE
jgi:hypothetical protein